MMIEVCKMWMREVEVEREEVDDEKEISNECALYILPSGQANDASVRVMAWIHCLLECGLNGGRRCLLVATQSGA